MTSRTRLSRLVLACIWSVGVGIAPGYVLLSPAFFFLATDITAAFIILFSLCAVLTLGALAALWAMRRPGGVTMGKWAAGGALALGVEIAAFEIVMLTVAPFWYLQKLNPRDPGFAQLIQMTMIPMLQIACFIVLLVVGWVVLFLRARRYAKEVRSGTA